MSVKFQITLPERLAIELKQAAAKRNVSLARMIRETMEERLRPRRGLAGSDPFDAITGLVECEETDLASRVNETLYR
jgi:hypothetical protein